MKDPANVRRGRQNRRKGNEYAVRVAKLLSLATGREYRREMGEAQTGRRNDIREDGEDRLPIVVEARKGQPSVKRAVKDAASYRKGPRDLALAFLHFDQRKPGEGAIELVALPVEDALLLLSVYEDSRSDPGLVEQEALRIREGLAKL